MVNLVKRMKTGARVLHNRARGGDVGALAWLREQDELAGLSDAVLVRKVQRRHCLAALARAAGFRGWPHARAVLAGEDEPDRGELMHREHGGAFWNVWSASYDEARAIRAEHGGFLLGYRRQFLIVEAPYLEHLGLDPEDPDWAQIGRDWIAPADREAWRRLTCAALDARLGRLP